jgi:hypothetical protein
MKKTFLTLGIASAMTFSTFAQDAAPTEAVSSSELKAGNITVEIDAKSPFSGGGASPFTLNNNVLRFRYFISEGTAIRLGFSYDRSSFNNTYGSKVEVTQSGATSTSTVTTDNKINIKSSMAQFSIMPGLEFHKMVSERLSAYYGGYFELTLNSKKATAEATAGNSTNNGVTTDNFTGSYKEEWKGAMVEQPDEDVTMASQGGGIVVGTGGTLTPTEAGFTRIGLVGVLGADYYITKGLYLGVEVGWGFNSTSYKSIEHTTTDSRNPVNTAISNTSTTKETELAKDKTGLQFAPYANAAFRFGFRF